MPAGSTSPAELVRRALAAADAGDADALAELMHPDLIVTLAGVPDPIIGRDRWMDGVTEMAQAFPDLETVVHSAVSQGDLVAVRCALRGTNRGPFNGMPATGRRIDVMSHDFYRIESGQVVEAWIVTDTATLFGQLS